MVALSTSKTAVSFYVTTGTDISGASHLYTGRRENLKSTSYLFYWAHQVHCYIFLSKKDKKIFPNALHTPELGKFTSTSM
jgi:hypothetical protein